MLKCGVMKKIFILLSTMSITLIYARPVNSAFDVYNHSSFATITVTLKPIECMLDMHNGGNGIEMQEIKFDLAPFSSYYSQYKSYLFFGAEKNRLGCYTEDSRFSIEVVLKDLPTVKAKNTISIHWNFGYSRHNDTQMNQFSNEAGPNWEQFGFNSDPYWANNRKVFWNGTDDDNENGLIIIDYYDCKDRYNCW